MFGRDARERRRCEQCGAVLRSIREWYRHFGIIGRSRRLDINAHEVKLDPAIVARLPTDRARTRRESPEPLGGWDRSWAKVERSASRQSADRPLRRDPEPTPVNDPHAWRTVARLTLAHEYGYYVVAYYLDKRSLREIARVEAVALTTVRRRFHRAVEAYRAAWPQGGAKVGSSRRVRPHRPSHLPPLTEPIVLRVHRRAQPSAPGEPPARRLSLSGGQVNPHGAFDGNVPTCTPLRFSRPPTAAAPHRRPPRA